MKGFMIYNSMGKRGLHLGSLAEAAAAIDGTTPLTLDHDLDVLPEAGRRLTVAGLARHVDDLASRLYAAEVRYGERIAIYKAANFDAWLLAAAAERIGAIPVMLSPALDGATVAALLGRLDHPHLLTDVGKLDAMADLTVTDLVNRVIIVAGRRPGVASLAELAGRPEGSAGATRSG